MGSSDFSWFGTLDWNVILVQATAVGDTVALSVLSRVVLSCTVLPDVIQTCERIPLKVSERVGSNARSLCLVAIRQLWPLQSCFETSDMREKWDAAANFSIFEKLKSDQRFEVRYIALLTGSCRV